MIQRLSRNKGCYCGETIEIQLLIREIHELAAATGWHSEQFLASSQASLTALHRPASVPARKRVYFSSGIHGDEPAGPTAIRELIGRNAWPADIDFWLCPCLNPTGFPLNRRENAAGIDLNRDYRHLQSDEIRAHVAWLERQPAFDLSLILHEDWEANGFYLYELNPDGVPSLAGPIIDAVAEVCPIEPAATVDQWPAHRGIIRPAIKPADRPQWPEALFLITRKTRLSYTLEAPSDFPIAVRVAALTTAVETALRIL